MNPGSRVRGGSDGRGQGGDGSHRGRVGWVLSPCEKCPQIGSNCNLPFMIR